MTTSAGEVIYIGQGESRLMLERVIGYLRSYPMFAKLDEMEFRELMTLMQEWTVPKASIVVQLGNTDCDFYVVGKGRVALRETDPRGRDPVVAIVGTGAVLNELAFATGRPADRTIETVEDTQFFFIPCKEFTALLADHDTLAGHIVYSAAAQNYVNKSRQFDEQRSGEQVLWFRRKHWLVLFNSLWLTYLLVIAMLASMMPGVRSAVSFVWVPMILAFGIVALGNAIWQVIDYFNDYYVITDQRVIHRERVILIYDQQDETPMGKVQNVQVVKFGGLYSLFDVGKLNIETQGARANIEFAFAPQPEAANKLITERRDRAQKESRASERSRVRVELRHQMKLVPWPEEKEKAKPKPPPLRQRIAESTINLRNDVLPRMRLVKGGQIIYRKHWLELFKTASVQFLLLALYIAAMLFIRFAMPDLAAFMFQGPFLSVVLVIGFALLGWFVWQYEDWRNDLYILTREQLIDYERTPFGFGGEKKITAGLDNVQNVTSTARGIIDTLFNQGDVSIKTGGTQNELNFARVWNPRNVQREIAKALEEFQNNKSDLEAKRRREEFIEWMGIYDELTRMHERNRIA